MRTDEGGFAIPVTLLLITLMTVMLASGFARVRADRQVAESTESATEALAIARSGLASFMAAQNWQPFDGYSRRMYVTGGYADITVRLVQNPADPMASQVWIVRSTGYVIDAGTGSTPRAQRTVAQFAQWQNGTINVRGAMATPNGLNVRRYGNIYIYGSDNGCGATNDVGLRTADVVTTGGGNPYYQVMGSPATVTEAENTIADGLDIDWLSVLDGGIVPDHTTPQNGDYSYPITLVTGDYTFNSTFGGSGLLIVTGDLTINSYFIWQGVILVGGRILFQPPQWSINYVLGYVASGLNTLIGRNPQRTQVGYQNPSSMQNTYTYIVFNGCTVDYTMDALTGFAPIENAWVDNWATY